MAVGVISGGFVIIIMAAATWTHCVRPFQVVNSTRYFESGNFQDKSSRSLSLLPTHAPSLSIINFAPDALSNREFLSGLATCWVKINSCHCGVLAGNSTHLP